jgi:hypothetical protein
VGEDLIRRTDAPQSPDEARALWSALYGGDIVLLPALSSVRALRDAIVGLLETELGTRDLEHADSLLGWSRVQAGLAVMDRILKGDALVPLFAAVLEQLQLAAGSQLVGPPRLRIVPGSADDPFEEAEYLPHRDTWFGNPQSQINWWTPVFPVSTKESCVFYPGYFTRPVPNRSARADASWFLGLTSESENPGREGALTPIDAEEALGFAAAPGDLVLFSAAQLHGTQRQRSGKMRLSVDFRTVDRRDDSFGVGAPNADNASKPFMAFHYRDDVY